MSKPMQFRYRGSPLNWVGNESGFYLKFSGELMSELANIFAPNPEQIRRMLFELRSRLAWSQAYLGAVLGVPKATLRKWELGQRNPSGAAKKLIWLLHALFLNPGAARNDRDIASWGLGIGRIDLGARLDLKSPSDGLTQVETTDGSSQGTLD